MHALFAGRSRYGRVKGGWRNGQSGFTGVDGGYKLRFLTFYGHPASHVLRRYLIRDTLRV